jgi:hypothetical protein
MSQQGHHLCHDGLCDNNCCDDSSDATSDDSEATPMPVGIMIEALLLVAGVLGLLDMLVN